MSDQIQLPPFSFFLSLVTPPVRLGLTRHFPLPIDEVGELPAAPDTRNSNPVAVVIERWIGKLRRRDHKRAFLDESLRQNAVQLRPEVFLFPILKNARARHRRLKLVAEILRHHRFDCFDVPLRYRLAKSADKCLKIHIGAFLPKVRFGFLLELGLLEFFFFLFGRLAARENECERKQTGKQDSHQPNVCHVCDLDSRLDPRECVDGVR